METNIHTSKKIVYKEKGFKIRRIEGYKGWACQCIKDCSCNEDYVKKNGENNYTFFRLQADKHIFKNAKQCTFESYDKAYKKLLELKRSGNE
jgi:hypothetical protein